MDTKLGEGPKLPKSEVSEEGRQGPCFVELAVKGWGQQPAGLQVLLYRHVGNHQNNKSSGMPDPYRRGVEGAGRAGEQEPLTT